MQGRLEKELGTTLIIVNAEGGSGTIGTTEYLSNYQPDGYTILYSLATPIVYKPLSGDTPYTYDDLTSVAPTSSQLMYLILPDNTPYKSAEDVPTLSELGYEGYETNNMAGFFYNKDVPQEISPSCQMEK